ncbi:MAG: hypothetical protein RR619_06425, partial [Raoultibacter sp.]
MKKFAFVFAFLSAFSFAADPWEPMTAPVEVPMAVSGNKIVPKIGGSIKVESVSVKSAASDYLLLNRTARPYFPNPTGQIGGLTSRIVQTVKANKPALVGAVRMLIKGPVAAIASTVLYSYLIELGWEYMSNASQWLVKKPDQSLSCKSGFQCLKMQFGNNVYYASTPDAFQQFLFSNCKSMYPNVIIDWFEVSTSRINYLGKIPSGVMVCGANIPLQKVSDGPASTISTPAEDRDIDSAAAGFVQTNPQNAIDTARDKQIPLPISAPGVGVPVIEATPQ